MRSIIARREAHKMSWAFPSSLTPFGERNTHTHTLPNCLAKHQRSSSKDACGKLNLNNHNRKWNERIGGVCSAHWRARLISTHRHRLDAHPWWVFCANPDSLALSEKLPGRPNSAQFMGRGHTLTLRDNIYANRNDKEIWLTWANQ